MGRGKAIALGIATVWPIIYVLFFLCSVFGVMMSRAFDGRDSDGEPLLLSIIIPLHLLTMLLMMVLIAVYIVHLFKTDRVPQDKKSLWAVVLFLGNAIAMPIYWYLYIWRRPEEPPAHRAPNV